MAIGCHLAHLVRILGLALAFKLTHHHLLWEIEDVVQMVEDWEAARRLEHDANP